MSAMGIDKKEEAGSAGPKHGPEDPTLLKRKSVLLGMAASMGLVFANAGRASAVPSGTVKPIAASQPAYAPKWTPNTTYMLGQQVINPNNDVGSAYVAHTSSATYAADTARWTLSSTYLTGGAQRGAVALGVATDSEVLLVDVEAFNTKIAPRRVDTVLYYTQFPTDPVIYGSWVTDAMSGGYSIDVGWSRDKLSGVLDGSQDASLLLATNRIKESNITVRIRLCHEFNLPGRLYGNGAETSAEFIAGWRYVVNYFRAHGATNVEWAWCVNTWGGVGWTAIDPRSWYPGDAYVDTIGLDGYMTSMGDPVTFRELFYDRWLDMVALAPSKPCWIYETGVHEETRTDKAGWFREMWATIRNEMPVAGIQYWNRDDGGTGTGADIYSIDSGGTNPTALAAFVGGVNSIGFVTNASAHKSSSASAVSVPAVPPMRTQRVYAPLGTVVSKVGTLGRLEVSPLLVPYPTIFDRAQIDISLASATGVVRLGMYADDGTGRPGALVADFGTVGCTTTGVKSISIILTVPAGWYYVGAVNYTAVVSMQSYATAMLGMPIGNGNTMESPSNIRNAWGIGGVKGPLPASMVSPAPFSDGPRVALRVA